MKSVFFSVLCLTATLLTSTGYASTRSAQARQLFGVLRNSGLKVQTPFDGAVTFEAFDVSCTLSAADVMQAPNKTVVSCELADSPQSFHPKQIHLDGKSAARLFSLLATARTSKGETGVATAFVRCSRYFYEGVDTTYDCQVATPF